MSIKAKLDLIIQLITLTLVGNPKTILDIWIFVTRFYEVLWLKFIAADLIMFFQVTPHRISCCVGIEFSRSLLTNLV